MRHYIYVNIIRSFALWSTRSTFITFVFISALCAHAWFCSCCPGPFSLCSICKIDDVHFTRLFSLTPSLVYAQRGWVLLIGLEQVNQSLLSRLPENEEVLAISTLLLCAPIMLLGHDYLSHAYEMFILWQPFISSFCGNLTAFWTFFHFKDLQHTTQKDQLYTTSCYEVKLFSEIRFD